MISFGAGRSRADKRDVLRFKERDGKNIFGGAAVDKRRDKV